jgi:hypothetical protein
MPVEVIGPIVPALAAALAAFVGAYASSRFGGQQREQADLAIRRRSSAEAMITPMIQLRTLLRNADTTTDVREWRETVTATYEAIEDARHLLPDRLRHLRRSTQFAIGEAVGVVASPYYLPKPEFDHISYTSEWAAFAVDYIDLSLNALRRWRDGTTRQAAGVSSPSFDDWLDATDRYRRR